MKIPEVTLKAFIDVMLDLIRTNYDDAVDKTTTFLYKALEGLETGNYVFLDEAVKIFVRDDDDPRIIDTRLLYDHKRASIPTIHVTVPGEIPFSDGIGMDRGYVDNLATGDPQTATSMTEFLTRTYNTKFNLVITGSNSFEVILITQILKSALIVNFMSLEYNGFRNPKIYAMDLKANDQIAPSAYARILVLDTFYELNVPNFDEISVVNSITFTGEMYND